MRVSIHHSLLTNEMVLVKMRDFVRIQSRLAKTSCTVVAMMPQRIEKLNHVVPKVVQLLSDAQSVTKL